MKNFKNIYNLFYSLSLGLDNIEISDTRDIYTSLFYVTSSINIMIKNHHLYQSEIGESNYIDNC